MVTFPKHLPIVLLIIQSERLIYFVDIITAWNSVSKEEAKRTKKTKQKLVKIHILDLYLKLLNKIKR